ncbi:MAG: hypothetical protein GQ531_03655 [Sulfurovum sp.]|nr:hypothetical protein [Sulfurovum sp.]
MRASIIILLLATLLTANQNYDSNGSVSGHLRWIHVLHGLDNNFDPQTGSTIGLNLKYHTPTFKGFYGTVGFHYVGDTGLTNFSRDSSGAYENKIASGIFMTKDFSSKAVLDEAWIAYEIGENLFKFGRKHPPSSLNKTISNPIAIFKTSQVENAYESFTFKTDELPDTTIRVSQITKMMYGSRTTTDYALIGEYTNTAGVARSPADLKGDFTPVGELAFKGGIDADGNTVDTAGITMLSIVNTSIPNTTVQLWNYYAYDILNFLQLQVDYTYTHSSSMEGTFKFQYIKENDVGKSLNSDLDSSIYGMMAMIKYEKAVLSFSYNSSHGETFNPWGFDPAFTSSTYSRNAYRDDVNAYKVAVKYSFSKNFIFSASYANYGQSKSYGGNIGRTLLATRDADELDMILTYKPYKKFSIKLLNARRTSEYESTSSSRKQNQFRVITQYSF